MKKLLLIFWPFGAEALPGHCHRRHRRIRDAARLMPSHLTDVPGSVANAGGDQSEDDECAGKPCGADASCRADALPHDPLARRMPPAARPRRDQDHETDDAQRDVQLDERLEWQRAAGLD
jgi:hypothetical protein